MSKEEFLTHRSSQCTRRIACQTCGATFPRVQTLITHLVSLENKLNPNLSMIIIWVNLYERYFQIEVRHGEMECSVCAFGAKSQKDLELHLRRHSEVLEKPYFCSHCDARFSTRKVSDVTKSSQKTILRCISRICTSSTWLNLLCLW